MEPKKYERQDGEPAYLPSAGYDYKKATLHTFVRREEVPADQLKYSAEHGPRGMRSSYGIIYVCTETQVERRWGLE